MKTKFFYDICCGYFLILQKVYITVAQIFLQIVKIPKNTEK